MPVLRLSRPLALATLLLPAAAHAAATLSSALIFSSNASVLDCVVSNVGKKPLPIVSATIRNAAGVALAASGCTAGSVLAVNQSCTLTATTQAGRGVIEVEGSAKSVRGQCQLTSAVNNILATTDLR